MNTDLSVENSEGLEQLPLHRFSEQAYLDYSMYVILDRALPQLSDGLKPVQRRILFAMSELGLSATAKFKKSARTVGDVLGKFHPHGDSACYEAMVLMAQDFSYRYPLVDGQGNWGAPDDPKSFAAMRYTESRLTAYSAILLSEVGQGTVDWQPNFDGTLEEPRILPARLPNLLLNGGSGIAVGMATDIPPHNLREVAAACVLLLKTPTASLDDLLACIPSPDFPTGAEIVTPPDELKRMYATGLGSIRLRARYQMETGDIVITELPYQVSGNRILEQIASQMAAKKLPMIEDLRDESDHQCPIRIVITPRSNRVDVDRLMLHLFATTELEKPYRVNMNVIAADGRPRVMGLKELLEEWLVFRVQTVRRRLLFRLDQVDQRLHLLAGLLIAFLNIDEVIRIIRTEDEPKPVLVAQFQLTEKQAEYVLNTRLRQLARLEEIKIRTEADELRAEQQRLNEFLADDIKLRNLVIDEINQDAKLYGDDRRSSITIRPIATAIADVDLVPNEPITVILSEKGWVRAAKGHDIDPKALSFRTGDQFAAAARLKSGQAAVFFDSTGRSYALSAATLPSARGQGEPLTGRVEPPPGAVFVAVLGGEPNDKFLLASTAGYGFVCSLSNLLSKMKTGKAVFHLSAGAKSLAPILIRPDLHQKVAVATSLGHLLIFSLADMPELSKGKGNRLMKIPTTNRGQEVEVMSGLAVLAPTDLLIIHSGQRTLRLKPDAQNHYLGDRGRRGALLPRGFGKVDALSTESGS